MSHLDAETLKLVELLSLKLAKMEKIGCDYVISKLTEVVSTKLNNYPPALPPKNPIVPVKKETPNVNVPPRQRVITQSPVVQKDSPKLRIVESKYFEPTKNAIINGNRDAAFNNHKALINSGGISQETLKDIYATLTMPSENNVKVFSKSEDHVAIFYDIVIHSSLLPKFEWSKMKNLLEIIENEINKTKNQRIKNALCIIFENIIKKIYHEEEFAYCAEGLVRWMHISLSTIVNEVKKSLY